MEDWISTLSISAPEEANIIGRELQMADERYKILIMAICGDASLLTSTALHSTVQGDRAGYG